MGFWTTLLGNTSDDDDRDGLGFMADYEAERLGGYNYGSPAGGRRFDAHDDENYSRGQRQN